MNVKDSGFSGEMDADASRCQGFGASVQPCQ